MTTKKLPEFVYFGSKAIVAGAVTATGAAAQDAPDGAYVGLSFGANSDIHSEFLDYSFEGSSVGVFAGYNIANGSFLVGGEISMSGDISSEMADFYGSSGLANKMDVRLRVGQVFGNVLVYGAVGVSSGDLFSGNSSWEGTAEGSVVAIGAEIPVSDRMFIGIEAAQHEYDYSGNIADYDTGGSLRTVSIRGGLRF